MERDFEAIHDNEELGMIDYSVICPTPPAIGAVVIVDPFSSGTCFGSLHTILLYCIWPMLCVPYTVYYLYCVYAVFALRTRKTPMVSVCEAQQPVSSCLFRVFLPFETKFHEPKSCFPLCSM